MVNSVAMNTTNGVSPVAPNMKAAPVSASPVAPVAVPLKSTHNANLANIVVSLPTASPKGNKGKERRVFQQKLKATAGASSVATNMTNASSAPPNVDAALASQPSVPTGYESMDGTVAFLSRDGEYGFIRHLGGGSDFFFGTNSVEMSAAVGDRVKFQFDVNAVKKSNHRRKALFVTVTHVRELREEVHTREARNDIKASVASAPLATGGQKVQWGLRNCIKPQPAVVAIAPLAIVAEAMSDTIDDKVLERLAVLVLKYMSERAPPPLPPPPATCN